MPVYTEIRENVYVDSLETILIFSAMLDMEGIETAYAGMATDANLKTLSDMGLSSEETKKASDSDFFIVAKAQSPEAFLNALGRVDQILDGSSKKSKETASYPTLGSALLEHPQINICTIAVPGEHAFQVTKEALEAGLHCIVFSSHVPLSQERELKELARKKGLLCMGPDCGVANINGAAFVLSSITNRGTVGICGASGCGIQHVAAFLHEAGFGVSQTIGTGGNDLKEEVGGISMLMGIDALEEDEDTKLIVLISRKPGDSVLKRITDRIKKCKKKVVACFMGADESLIRDSGAVYAGDLDECVIRTLELLGKEYRFESDQEIHEMAKEAASKMNARQKYVRGIYCGGTYCDEAMSTLQKTVGGIYSNCPLSPEWKLENSNVSVKHTVIDAGEEEFTQGRPHPTLEPSMRLPLIEKEGDDPETAVLLLDFILTPPANPDPAGVTIPMLKKIVQKSKARGGEIAVVASVLGTDADFQNVTKQREKLREAGVYVCKSNRQAARLAAEIIRLNREGRQKR